MKNKNILISIIASSILSMNLNAASLWDSNSVFNNVTSSSIATDPISGGTYMSGGAIEVRFKTTGSFPPIMSFGAPGLKASCSGITFDAGYAVFMNLERLGQQLSQAGASLAYGVLIGLVYTMPGVEQAFTKLNEWSQWLQSFLADSCNIGTRVGKELGKDAWRGLEKEVNSLTADVPSPSEYFDKPIDPANLLLKIIKGGTEDQVKKAFTGVVSDIIRDIKGGAIATYINTLIKKGEENVVFSSTELVEFKNLDDLGLTESTKIMAYFISSIIESDIAIDENAMTSIIGDIKNKDGKKLAEKLEEKGGKDKTIKVPMARNQIAPEVFIDFLLNGLDKSKPSPFANIKGLRVALVSLNSKDGISKEFIALSSETTASTNAFSNFEGYIAESKKLVYKTYNQTMIKLKGVTATDPITDTIKVTSAYPVMYEIIRNVVLTTNKQELFAIDSSDGDITEILNYIAYKNAIALANIAIQNMQLSINKSSSELHTLKKDPSIANPATNSVFSHTENVENLKEQIKKVNESIEKLKETLKKTADKVESQDSIRKMNERFVQILRERNLQKGDR